MPEPMADATSKVMAEATADATVEVTAEATAKATTEVTEGGNVTRVNLAVSGQEAREGRNERRWCVCVTETPVGVGRLQY